MNLEMEQGTDALAAAVDAAPPRELERQPYDERDIAVIRALQGPMEVAERPYDAAARRGGDGDGRRSSSTCEGMVERKLLRRVAAILYHRRAGFSANGMGVWRVPADQVLEVGGRMAAVRGISHCYQRPTYADWPYSVFTMAHGRSKEECDAILDGIAEEHEPPRRGPRGALLLHRVQEGAPALLHRRVRALGTEHAGVAGRSTRLCDQRQLQPTGACLTRRAALARSCRVGSTPRSAPCGRSGATTRSSSSAARGAS